MKKSFFVFLYASALCCFTALPAAEDALRIYQKLPLYGLEFSRLKDAAPTVLSKQGRLSHLPAEGCVLVYDTPKMINSLKVLINRLRLEMFNVRILIDYIREDPVGETRLVFGIPTLPDPLVRSSPPGAPGLDVDFYSVHFRNAGTKWLLTADGQAIAIWTGKYAGTPDWLAGQTLVPEKDIKSLGTAKLHPVSGKAFSKIRWNSGQDASAVMVLPICSESGAELTLIVYPRIQYYDPETHHTSIWAISSMAATVKLQCYQRLKLGTFFYQNQQDYLHLFGQKFFRLNSDRPLSELHLTCESVRVKDTPRDPRSMLQHKQQTK